MRIDIDVIKAFITENSETIMTAAGIGALYFIAKKCGGRLRFGIDGVSIVPGKSGNNGDVEEKAVQILVPGTSVSAAVKAYYDAAKSETSAYYIFQHAKKIRDAVKSGAASDEDKSFAIRLLSAIASDRSMSSYYRNEILELIKQIA